MFERFFCYLQLRRILNIISKYCCKYNLQMFIQETSNPLNKTNFLDKILPEKYWKWKRKESESGWCGAEAGLSSGLVRGCWGRSTLAHFVDYVWAIILDYILWWKIHFFVANIDKKENWISGWNSMSLFKNCISISILVNLITKPPSGIGIFEFKLPWVGRRSSWFNWGGF